MLATTARHSLRFALLAATCVACSSATSEPPPPGASILSTDANLSGCKGKASSTIPSDGVYVITTFGGPSESQQMSCGSHTQNGSWYYAASRQRYGCGSHIRIEANGKCVVAKTDDYGPDVCVENAANRPIIDVSPLVAEHLFGVSGMGWSDGKLVTVNVASSSDALGPCAASAGGGEDPGGSGSDPGAGGGGGSGGSSSCYCDAQCAQYGDCCSSCAQGSGGSGSGTGGSGSGSGGSASCYCDAQCAQYGDCCSNCAQGSGGSGSGGSGGSAGCYCDAECAQYGDCCAGCGSGGGSGSGGSSGAGSCYCDAECAYYGDCCSDCP